MDNISLITQWRELLLKRLLSAFPLMAVVGWPAAYYVLSQSDNIFENHPLPLLLIVNIALVSITALAILRYVNQIPILLRKSGLVLVVFGIGVALTFDSLSPESSFYLIGLSSIIACVLIGNRCGIFVLMVSFFYIVGSQFSNIVQDDSISPAWIVLLVEYLSVFFIIITSWSFLVNRLQNSNLALQEKNEKPQATLNIALDSARKFEFFLNSATDIFWIADVELNFSYISPAVEKLSGFSINEALTLGASGILEVKESGRASEVLFEELAYDHDERRNSI